MKRARLLGLVIILGMAFASGGCFLFPNHPPIAAFTPIYGVDTEDPLVVQLNASASSDPDGDKIVAYMWTFFQQDGASADVTVITPEAYSASVPYPIITVRFPVEGAYTVTLVVRDCRGKDSEPVSVSVIVPTAPTNPTE